MTDDDFNNLVAAVAEAFGVSKTEILKKYSQKTSKARYFLCHIIYYGLPHLRRVLLENADISKTAYYKGTAHASEYIKESNEDLCTMNEIREKVGLPRLKDIQTCSAKISNTKTMFGFDYTELDILRYRNACRKAAEYMRGLCSVGRQPLPDGKVYIVRETNPILNPLDE